MSPTKVKVLPRRRLPPPPVLRFSSSEAQCAPTMKENRLITVTILYSSLSYLNVDVLLAEEVILLEVIVHPDLQHPLLVLVLLPGAGRDAAELQLELRCHLATAGQSVSGDLGTAVTAVNRMAKIPSTRAMQERMLLEPNGSTKRETLYSSGDLASFASSVHHLLDPTRSPRSSTMAQCR